VKPVYKRMLKGMQKKRRRKKGEPWFLYIIECSDGSFYTGVTKNIGRRLQEHNAGKASKYTRLRLPVRLRYTEECAGRAEALVRECEVKALSRAKKEELVLSVREALTEVFADNPAGATNVNVNEKRIPWILCLVLCVLVFACNGGVDVVEEEAGDTGDAGAEDGGYDYDYGDDGGPGDDGGTEPDEGLGDDLGLLVPPGTCACGSNGVGLGALECKGRICFRPGLHRLYKDRQTFEVDLIESVELGPEAVAAEPTSSGVFTVSPPPQPDGDYSFVFQQEFTAQGTPFAFSLKVTFPCENSEPTVGVTTLNDEGLCDRLFWTSATWGDTPIYLGPCQYSLYYCGIIRFQLEGGDVLKVETCHYCPRDYECKASMAGMRRAEFTSGQDSRYQGDYFGLVHSMRHHDWGSDSLARFDQAVGSVQAVYIGTNQYPDHFNYAQATYLDGSLDVLETCGVTGVEYLSEW
jgi:putative endonuclease